MYVYIYIYIYKAHNSGAALTLKRSIEKPQKTKICVIVPTVLYILFFETLFPPVCTKRVIADSQYASYFRSVIVPPPFLQNYLCSHCPSFSVTFQNST